MGGGKPARELAGRPLLAWPAAALAEPCDRVVVIAKADTELPGLPGVERWDEPEEPRHPLTGIVHALERARNAVLVCAADMPYVTADACRALIAASRKPRAPAAVAATERVLQPTFGVYMPAALARLRAADADVPLRAAVEALDPARVELPAAVVRSVNTPEDLAAAEAELC